MKRLSETSGQGFEEFKNEVLLTARLQHVNLVRVLGFCVDTHQHMLVYEYMPNKSLDFHLFGNSFFFNHNNFQIIIFFPTESNYL